MGGQVIVTVMLTVDCVDCGNRYTGKTVSNRVDKMFKRMLCNKCGPGWKPVKENKKKNGKLARKRRRKSDKK